MPPVIVARDLYKAYPGFPPVLRGVNIDVQPGEMAAIMGPSGCGKSTMLHVLGMLHKPDSGTLEILGQNVLTFNSEQTAAFRRGNMGFVMQASNLFEHSTVFENVEFPLIYENVPPQERWERVIRALDLVRLSARVHYRSNRLSGGEQQRVAIARAMVNNPRILLADEPTGALDARTSRVIMENFRNLCHTGGVAMVMVTHDPKMAEYCDSVYTLDDGLLHCHKHEPPVIAAAPQASFLDPPRPVVRGALVANHFPSGRDRSILQLAGRMNEARLLARIYALRKNGIFSSDEGYSLPLAVRRMGFWRRLKGMGRLQRIKKAHPLAHLPAPEGFGGFFARRAAMAAGAVLACWTAEDNIEFIYAAGAGREAGASWVVKSLADIPFAMAVRPGDFPRLGANWPLRARDAAFITCSTEALRKALLQKYPAIPADKALLLPNPPQFAPVDDETDTGTMPPQQGKPADLLVMAGPALKVALNAMAILKKRKAPFRLTILGKKQRRWQIRRLGLRKYVNFAIREDRLAEDFRLADIFIALPEGKPGDELAMPWQVCEAMFFGKPIVCLGITPGMAPLEDGRNCLECASAETMAASIERLMADRALGRGLGEAARRDARAAFDLDGAARALTDRIIMASGHAGAKKDGGGDGI